MILCANQFYVLTKTSNDEMLSQNKMCICACMFNMSGYTWDTEWGIAVRDDNPVQKCLDLWPIIYLVIYAKLALFAFYLAFPLHLNYYYYYYLIATFLNRCTFDEKNDETV